MALGLDLDPCSFAPATLTLNSVARLTSRIAALLAACAACVPGCASVGGPGGIMDGTSLSYGWHNRGRLVAGVRLSPQGDGYAVPSTWSSRGNLYGTEELVGLIVRAGRRLAVEQPGDPLYVADLSPAGGGRSKWHRSHQTGRDVDLILFALDEQGRPTPAPTQMPVFAEDGRAPVLDAKGTPIPGRYVTFDVERNWRVVRALANDPAADIQYLFLADHLRARLLHHATAMGESPDIIAAADALLKQPADSAKHDDHLHVRIYCPLDDRSLGCRDVGPLRWWKKTYKYLPIARLASVVAPSVPFLALGPFCGFLSGEVVAMR